jgi:hypothetical protein
MFVEMCQQKLLQVVFSQWCIWGCRSLGWHCHWASSSQNLECSVFIMLDSLKYRQHIPSKHQKPHPSNTLFYPTRPESWKVQLFAIMKLIPHGNHASEGVLGKQTKSQTGTTFIQWKITFMIFLSFIPYVCTVQISNKYEASATWQSTCIFL